jgi:hypothetical protein
MNGSYPAAMSNSHSGVHRILLELLGPEAAPPTAAERADRGLRIVSAEPTAPRSTAPPTSAESVPPLPAAPRPLARLRLQRRVVERSDSDRGDD